MRPVSARERRLVALLILMAGIAALHFLLVLPIANGFAARAAKRERLELRYLHNLRTIAAIPRLRRQAERARAALTGYVADARSPGAGREWLRERLQAVVTRTGGAVAEGADAEARPGWARVRARLRLTPKQLTDLLDQLQRTPPWIVIESLSVTAADDTAATPSAPLDVDLDVSAPIRPASLR